MKRILILTAVLATTVLTGCASNRDTGALVGGIAGGIIGNQVGGGVGKVVATGVGAAVGSAVGSAVGQDMDQPRQPAPVVVREIHHNEVVIVRPVSMCNHYPTVGERVACERGVRQRIYEEQRHRENEAYRRGYGR